LFSGIPKLKYSRSSYWIPNSRTPFPDSDTCLSQSTTNVRVTVSCTEFDVTTSGIE
jgi:hypothetical protein